MQGVGDFCDEYRSVIGHAFLLLCDVDDLLHWFLFIVGPDLQRTGISKDNFFIQIKPDLYWFGAAFQSVTSSNLEMISSKMSGKKLLILMSQYN